MKEFLAVAKAVADENRARILLFLREDELCVCQVIEMLGLAPSTVSNHLNILQRAGLVEGRKDGRWMYYRLTRKGVSATARATIHWAEKCLAGDAGRPQGRRTTQGRAEDGHEEALRTLPCPLRIAACVGSRYRRKL